MDEYLPTDLHKTAYGSPASWRGDMTEIGRFILYAFFGEKFFTKFWGCLQLNFNVSLQWVNLETCNRLLKEIMVVCKSCYPYEIER